ncbi:hypothetical protein ABID08_002060 [Rhizobium binae]|uniref:Uncharacterized protein n=1 Tax=Rhizobium binae TaxID=1138190 RepID=A0ABV2ME07_9HYPH|nr:hypothetical protein [Rhizobium binae]MBX4992889.1 hypothetical protein [Rhizobium binae]NKL52803.1 hypothetical protein [Rhizobium leguminosarum bv. viciae]QSY84170.1 hypothetical protein J2J99_10475 [Rhizobium binae]
MPAPTAAIAWRDYVTDGVPSSGNHNPDKLEIRSWGLWLESFISAIGANSGSVFTTRAALFADLAHAANSMAWVIGDTTVAYNGIYRKSGASGTGSWTRVADLPYSFITAVDAGAGTPNAIQATSTIPVSESALIVMNIFEANTGSPVTVSFNGGSTLTVKSNSGNDISAGGLTANMRVLGVISGTEFRLVSDQVSAAIVAAAEAAAASAASSASTATSAAATAVAAAASITNIPIVFKAFGDLTADTVLSYSGSFPVVAGSTVVQVSSKGWSYIVAASGASDYHIITAGGVKLYALPFNGYVNVEQFIQAGYVNSTTNVLAAFTAAIATAHRVKGDPEHIYGINGKITLAAGTWLEDISAKQLAPHATTSVVTIGSTSVSNITLKRVKVDRNGDGTGGSLNNAAGISISGGSGHYLEDVEVFGSDIGTGIVVSSATDFQIVRPHVHDILYVSASLPSDDQAQGLWLSSCSDFSVIEPKIHHIGGIVGGTFRRAFGRMMPIGLGCSFFRIVGGDLYDGDVGIDLTGSKGNVNFALMGVTVRDVETWGIKLANYNRFGEVIGCNVHRAGSAGFVGSGPTVDVDPDTPVPDSLPRHVTFTSCGAWDTGYGNTGRGTSQPAGFLITPGAAPSYQDFPRGYRMVGCVAYDNQTVKTQYHGFRCETTFGGAPLNEVINCKSGGYAAGGQHVALFPYPACRAYNSAAISIPNNTSTIVSFNAEDFDGSAMHSTSSNTDAIFVQEAGWYRVEGQATFAQNGTGLRSAIVSFGGVNQPRIADSQPGSAVNDTTVRVSGMVYISDVTGSFKLSVYQNSGGALNASNVQLSVTRAMPNN